METKEINIKWKGKDEKVKIKKIGWKTNNEILRQSSKFKLIGSSMQSTIDPIKMKELYFEKGIVEAPFDMSNESLDELSPKAGDDIYNEIRDFSNISDKKKEPITKSPNTEQEQ